MVELTEIEQTKNKHAGGRPRKYKSVRSMKVAIGKYFTNDVIPTKAGLTLHLGFANKQSLWDYRNNFAEFTALIDETFTKLERYWEERLAGSQCSGATFWLKNNSDYTDKVLQTSNQDSKIETLTPDQQRLYTEIAEEIMARERQAQIKLVKGTESVPEAKTG